MVALQAGAVCSQRIGRRVLRDGNQTGIARLGHIGRRHAAQVDEVAVGIAQSIVSPARDIGVAVPAPAGAVGTQRYAVFAVGEQHGGLDPAGARHQLTRRRSRHTRTHRATWLSERFDKTGNLSRNRLLKQAGDRAQAGVRHGPAARGAIQQHVGQCHQRHALVVGHESGHPLEPAAATLAFCTEIQCLNKTPVGTRLQRLKGEEIRLCGRSIEHGGQACRIRRHHEIVGRRSPQRESGHALRGVLVSERVVPRRIGAF